jgi:hypothetical protein
MCRALLTLLVCAPLVLAEDKAEPKGPKAPKAREVAVDGKLPAARGQFGEPAKITTEKELEKSIADKDTRAAILKKVDLKKEYLLLFAWAGSGQDKLSFSVSKDGKQVTFTRHPGATDDLNHHVKLYAVPAKATYKVGK